MICILIIVSCIVTLRMGNRKSSLGALQRNNYYIAVLDMDYLRKILDEYFVKYFGYPIEIERLKGKSVFIDIVIKEFVFIEK